MLILDKKLVSIIIPCHNAEKWIGSAIKSAIDQTWRPIEVIVVDDGSTDSSLSVCAMFAANPNFRIITQKQLGAAAARNTGIRESKGSWIQFLDADDLLDPDKIKLQMEIALMDSNQYLYSSSWGRFSDNSKNWSPDQSELCVGNLDSIEWIIHKYATNSMMALHAWLVSRTLLDRENLWNESLSLNDDGEYFDRLVLAACGVKHVKHAKCFYRTGHTVSLSRRCTRSAIESAKHSLELGCERLLSVENSERTRRACAAQMQFFAYQFYPHATDLADEAADAALRLGGAKVELPGGFSIKILSRIIGWRLARRLQHSYYQKRYGHP